MVSLEEIKKIAELSRLALPEEELRVIAEECSKLMEGFSRIQELSFGGEVSSHFLKGTSPIRQDYVVSSDSEKIFKNFPFKRGRFVKVPKSRGLVK